jgi:hypothetical protein
VEDFNKRYDVRLNLWKWREDFEKKKNTWMNEDFKNQDSEDIEATYKRFFVQTRKLKDNNFGPNEQD